MKMLSEIIRRSAYWGIDCLKGQPVKKHLNEIIKIMENPDLVKQHQERQLKELISYCVNNVPFYKNYSDNGKLDEYPIINKATIKDNFELMKSPLYTEKDVIKLSTSGSTGTPFSILQDKSKRNRVLAEMMYFWGKAGYKIGMRYVFFRIWTDKNRKSKLSAFSRNLVMSDILTLDEKNLENIRQMLKKDRRIKMLLGYASTFENLANYLIKCGDTSEMFNIKTIISGSEVLTDETRDKLKQVFDCPVYSYYSNQENGSLAQECDNFNEFHLNSASYIIEILKLNSDEPADDGELGRVIVTDLYNRAMPLIRYDTGDLAIQQNEAECGLKGQTVKNISGRAVDMIYATDSTPLSPHTWSVYMWKYDKLKQYQFVQNAQKDYVMIINGGDMYTDEDITEHLKKILGNDANIKIERVDEIPVLASGKFKKTVCNYKKI
jgi:phenylacetate-CoA ligase